MRSINCKKFGKAVCIRDLVGKYGDWLFKQPLILALEKKGFTINASNNPHPLLINTPDNECLRSAEWVLVFTRSDKQVVKSEFAKQYKNTIEIRRVDRFTETVKVWKKGILISTKNFKSTHEQERLRLIAHYLCLPYQERFVNVLKPKRRIFVINMNVGEEAQNRLRFNFQQINNIIKSLREQGFGFRVLKDVSRTSSGLAHFYAQFDKSEIIKTKNFHEACRVIDNCDFYFGVDSGLAHYAVEFGKITFALYSLKHHSRIPLFQSTFRNHLCYFGDTLFSDKLLSDFERIKKACADEKLLAQIAQFLKNGKGINTDPYSNERKVFALSVAFLSQDEYRKKIAREIYANSASIFFTDEVIRLNIRKLAPFPGKIFIDSRACVQAIHKLIALHPDSKNISFYAKPCSFFYGTAMQDGSSDIDLPTLYLRGKVLYKDVLLKKIELILKKYNFSTELPHQAPIISAKIQSLRSVVKNGQLVYSLYRQKDKYNLQKYEARVKLKIIMGEMSRPERQELETSLRETVDGWRLLKEIKYLENDSRYFKKWKIFIRKIIRATSIFGDFGAKGHVFLKVEKRDCAKTAVQINGLMRHGIIYAVGVRLYPLWNVRRPQHGWFQPITILAESPEIFQEQIKKALENPIYAFSHMRPLRLLSEGKLVPIAAIGLLRSPNPLIFMEAYRYIAFHNAKFSRKQIFSEKELRAYARESHSNCDSIRDRKLSLWSLATGIQLPLSSRDTHYLTKYNCFVEFFTSGSTLDVEKTKFFDATGNTDISTKDFIKPFAERIIRLLREYYLYTLATGFPKEFLYEKQKEISFVYFVQGRVLLEGPRAQARKAAKFLHKLDIANILFDGRVLREIINSQNISVHRLPTEFLLSWLIRQDKSEEFFTEHVQNTYINRIVLPVHKYLYRSINENDI